MKIYVVGVMQFDLEKPNYRIGDKHVWFFFKNFEDAEKCVLENHTDIFEYYYNLALIEEHEIYDLLEKQEEWNSPKQWWYQAEYHEGDISVRKIEKPESFKGFVNFWAG